MASVDLHLGTWFLTLRPSRMTHMEFDSPGSPVQLTKTHYVSFGDQYILHPRSSSWESLRSGFVCRGTLRHT